MKKKRLAICGCTGHVVKFGEQINSYPESEIVVVWDLFEEAGKEVADILAVPFEPDYEKVLSDYDLDGVLILTDNRYKADLMIRAANRGISIFVEKPMCVNLQEAYAVRKAVKENNVRFFMTDPFVRSGLLMIEKLIKDGTLGKITEADFRICQYRFDQPVEEKYDFASRQGGIMASVGGHALHMAHYLFGKPEKLSSVLTWNSDLAKESNIEENARITMLYPDDLVVGLQCSYVSRGLETGITVRGTRGTAVVEQNRNLEEGNEKVRVYHNRVDYVEYTELPQNPKRHTRYFVDMLVNNYPNDIVGKDPLSNSGVSIDNAVEYVEIINTIYQSANKGLTEVI